MRPYPLCLIAAVTLILGCTNERTAINTTSIPEDPRWSPIDSLAHIGQYAAALTATEPLLAEARTHGDWQQEFRAMMTIARFQRMTGVEDTTIIGAFETRSGTAPFPLNALLHSVIAGQYWAYYRDNRWEILERTTLAEATTDMGTWTQPQFMERVIHEFRASLKDADSLKTVPNERIAGVLLHAGQERTEEIERNEREALLLRATLFDLLAHRALDVFRNTETRVAEPASRYTLNDARLFGLFEDFAHMRMAHADSTSWELQALHLYQELERAHLSDSRPEGLVDNTLLRLEFVREHSTVPDKDSLFLQALITLATRLPQDTCLGDVMVAQARWHQEMAGKYQRLLEGTGTNVPWKQARKQALALCERVIARFPASYAAGSAEAMRLALLDTELSVQLEEGVRPEAPFKAAITSRNVPMLWLRLVKDDWSTDEYLQNNGRSDGEKLLERKALREWSIALPDDGDLNTHMTEIAVDGLPLGHYALLASDSASFRPKADNITFGRFWVTRLAMTQRWKHGDLDLLVVDRGTGAPKPGVGVVSWSRDYREGNAFKRSLEHLSTGPDGFMRTHLRGVSGSIGWELQDGDDRFISSQTWIPDDHETERPDEPRVFLFTDRAIYRPGQPVMFKGLVTHRSGKGNEVVAGFKTTVELLDVNYEKVDSLSVTSDAYGAFHGTFTAPQGALTGSMDLQTPYGSQGIQVEEYKRPTFEVTFDPIAGQQKLGQEATVTGLAKSYAGVPLDGARVQWTLKRSTRMPWWCGWWYRGWLPWGRSTQVAQGEAECDTQGKFTVKFAAEADDQFPRGADPIFNFTVEASVVDISGETQSGSTQLSLGHKSISIELGLGESLSRAGADSVDVHVANLNGQRVDVPMDIRVFKLQAPPTPLRERLWERPDRSTIDREEHASKFPQDVYGNENDPLSWTRGLEVMRKDGYVGRQRLDIRDARSWDVGSYLIEAVARDADGEEVKVAKHFTVFDPAIQNTGFVAEAFHAELLDERPEPGTKARLLLSSALPEGRVLMEVEREGRIAVSRWFILKNTQQLVELPVLEEDRGGFSVHLFCVERGRLHSDARYVDVPWTNKELKLEWMSFRDKLLPGSEEEWRLSISGSKGEKVAAQLLGGMYDASLDHFVAHGWDLPIWESNYPELGWLKQEPFGEAGGQTIWREGYRYGPPNFTMDRAYPRLNDFGYDLDGTRYYRRRFRGERAKDEMYMAIPAAGAFKGAQGLAMDGDADGTFELTVTDANGAERTPTEPTGQAGQPTTGDQQPLRSDFRETAFFFPDLLTDRDGNIVLRFKTPDALTRWKVMGLAHTKDLRIGQVTREAVTQKPLMVIPNLPRFLRSGDRITLTAKINVLEKGRAEGLASLELFDPYTNIPLNRSFGLQVKDRSFVAAQGESAVVDWSITVPEGVDVCGLRITVNSKGGPRGGIVASDGEERALPVLTDKVLVTESVPLWSNTKGTKTFTLPNLLASANLTTLRSRSLKLEYTPNPAWYAVQALPYLMEYPHECAEQVFSRYYADRLAAHIVEGRPAIKSVFEQWKQAGPESFAGKLERNPELKNTLLAETPWVVNARSERESRQRIALLFDLQRMGSEEAAALKKLRDMQLADGAWPWWSGMMPSRWITQHIVAGFGHMEVLKATGHGDGRTQDMLQRAVAWLDQDAVDDHARVTRRMSAEEMKAYRPGYTELHYLYARSFFQRWPLDGQAGNVARFYQERAAAHWLEYGLQEQAMIALALHRLGDRTTPALILESLEQRATKSGELGMYWKDFVSGMDWNSFPTETHALMIEAFDVVTGDEASVNALRTHLLKLKQTTDWKTTKATAEACYALLLTGDNWLDDAAPPAIMVGSEAVRVDKQEAGTGAIEQTWTAERIKPAMGAVTITSKADKPSWGALHWQYFESMDKVRPHESPFNIKKQVMLTRQGDNGPKLLALEGQKLKPGDKLTIRVELRTDRCVDHVHMKDLRAAGLEPTEALSGYRYQGGLGYYQSIRDASTNFFFDRIAPGTYVFEYTLRVTHEGEFSNGITTAMCMYAPEFSSHSEGVRLKVEGE